METLKNIFNLVFNRSLTNNLIAAAILVISSLLLLFNVITLTGAFIMNLYPISLFLVNFVRMLLTLVKKN